MERCSTHAWHTPAPGDASLVCDVCESRLDLASDLTPQIMADIVRDYRRHFGPIVGQHFEEALSVAVEAARSGMQDT